MQLHQDAQVLGNSGAHSHTSSCAEVSQADAARPTWRRTGAFTGVAAVASAGIVLPLMGESAMAYDEGSANDTSQKQAQVRAASVEAFEEAGKSQALMPEIAQRAQAAFSTAVARPGPTVPHLAAFANTAARTGAARQSATAGTSFVSSEPSSEPLIEKGADGNWTLSYQARHRQEAQKLVSQLTTEARSSQSQKACQGAECESAEYINSQLPEARRTVQALEKNLQAFETRYGQQDMLAYQRVLSSRIAEINRQDSQLAIDMKQTQRFITQLKSRLMTVNAGLRLAEQVIAQDASYQDTWQRLTASEQALLDEFSKVDIDATALNETYADYQYQQQALQRIVEESLSNYLMAPGTVSPDFIYQVPAALNVMQDLVVATHDYQVQQLRQATIATIKQRLQKRESDLLTHVGEYDQLKRELAAAQQLVMQYERDRNRLNIYAAIDPSNSGLLDKTLTPAVTRAQTLSLDLPEGSLAKTILGIAVSAGAIATVAARRKRPSADVPNPADIINITPINRQTLALYGEQSIADQLMDARAMANQSPVSQRPAAYAGDSNSVESRLLRELLQITEPSTQSLTSASKTAPITTIKHPTIQAESSFSEKDLIVETMARELDEDIFQSLEESSFIEEQDRFPIDPVQLSLEEVDVFAERAVRWVLEDLGFTPKDLPSEESLDTAAVDPALTLMDASVFDPHPDSYRTNEFAIDDDDFREIERGDDDHDLAEIYAELKQGRYSYSAS